MKPALIATMMGLAGMAFIVPVAHSESNLDEVIGILERTRKLQFERPVDHRRIAREELRRVLEKEIDRSLDLSFEDYVAVLRSLRLIDDEATNPRSALLDLYESQVLAFYDPVDHVYYSIDDAPIGVALPEALSRAIVVHELMHALQDQAFDIGVTLEARREDWDSQLALHAIIEGEATLVMLGTLADSMGASLDALLEEDGIEPLLSQLVGATDATAPGSPRYFVSMMTFPYVSGLRFVAYAYKQGGWKAVDRLYADPPVTTEQILNPDLYFSDDESLRPVRVASSGGVVAPLLLDSSLGEFHWSFLLGEEAGRGWGGDRTTVTAVGGSMEVRVDSCWDTERDAEEFSAAFEGFSRSRHMNAIIEREGKRVALSWARDRGTAPSHPAATSRSRARGKTNE